MFVIINNRLIFVRQVVDSLSRTDADGALQHAARRQLEVFHSQVPGARVQVVKTHSISKWTNKTSPTKSIEDSGTFGNKEFENLQVSNFKQFRFVSHSPQTKRTCLTHYPL